MTSLERWKNILAKKTVDRVPCDLWATKEVIQKLCAELNCQDYWQLIDKMEIDAYYTLELPYIGPTIPKDYDIWGVKFNSICYDSGTYQECVEHPLDKAECIEDFKSHNWPSADCYDYSAANSLIEKHHNRPIMAGSVEPFLCYCNMRGLEKAMMDLVLQPDMVEYAFDRIFKFATQQFERSLEQVDGKINLTDCSEDLGSQTGPLFSIDCFRRFHKPRAKKYIELAHQHDVSVLWHSDGSARMFIPELIELGVDILNPIQWRCPGMDIENLKKDFGENLTFHGGIDNQEILPFGSKKEVRNEVINCFEKLSVGGGYVCAPCHNIQPVTPVENILEMYNTIKEISSDSKYTNAM